MSVRSHGQGGVVGAHGAGEAGGGQGAVMGAGPTEQKALCVLFQCEQCFLCSSLPPRAAVQLSPVRTSQPTIGELEAGFIRQSASSAWLSQGQEEALRLNMCTHPCTPLKIPNSSPSSQFLGSPIQCPLLRCGPRDCPLHPVPYRESAEGSLGLEPTVFAWGDVAALPVGGPGPPGAQVLGHCLVGEGVHTFHTPGLEAVVAAGRCAHGPQADPPVYAAGF